MKSTTARRPDQSRSARPTKSRKYIRQSAHVGMRRDGKPLIFGWGGHLSRSEKIHIQRYIVWTIAIFIVIAILATFFAFWVNIHIIVPNQTIVSVNGQNVPLSDYYKLVVFNGQEANNQLNGPHGLMAQKDALSTKVANDQANVDNLKNQLQAAKDADKKDSLQKQLDDAQKLHDSDNHQLTALQTNITTAQANYTQSQLANQSANWLQDDLVIRQWLDQQSSTIQAKIDPSAGQIDQAMKHFMAEIPKGSSYAQILSKYSVSNDDLRATMALQLRRDQMNSYQRMFVTSPTRQVKVCAITLSTTVDAQDILNQLKKGADFATLAKNKSVDDKTKANGGEIGWLIPWQYTVQNSGNIRGSGAIDHWLFDPARKVNDLSPVLTENGTYHIVQVEDINPSRPVDDPSLLDTLKSGDTPLLAWLNLQEINAQMNSNANLEFDPAGMLQDIPTSPPGSNSTGSGGMPSMPGQ